MAIETLARDRRPARGRAEGHVPAGRVRGRHLARCTRARRPAEYQDPALFFQRTFITEGMRLLLDSVVKRLAGKGGEPVIQLQTAFGGGKTHTMLAVYHLATGEVPAERPAGCRSHPGRGAGHGLPARPRRGARRHQLVARPAVEARWQVGANAVGRTRRGSSVARKATRWWPRPTHRHLAGQGRCSRQLLERYAPCVDADGRTGGATCASSRKARRSAAARSIQQPVVRPGADRGAEGRADGGDAGVAAGVRQGSRQPARREGAARRWRTTSARVQALWKPVATEEAFEIVRRRLFEPIRTTSSR